MKWFCCVLVFIHSRVHSFSLTEQLPWEQAQCKAPVIGHGAIGPLLRGPLMGWMVQLSPWAPGIFWLWNLTLGKDGYGHHV